MRIVAGTARGRSILVPPGRDVRPTQDRVREAIFNSLHSAGLVEGRRFVDLFAGSGALGLEALSRGAEHCTFVEPAPPALAAVRANIASLGFADRATVIAGRAEDALLALTTRAREAPLPAVDVVLCDPPYAFAGWEDLLVAIRALNPEAVVIESDRTIDSGSDLRILKQQRYSGTVVSILRAREGPLNTAADGELS